MRAKLAGILSGVVGMALAPSAMAVGYASGVTKVGDDVSFILNQNALTVQAILDGGAQILNLGTTAGSLNFNMAGYSTYQIQVDSFTGAGWSQFIPDGGASDRNFYTPTGVSVDKNPASANFGKVFVSNATSATTGAGRNTPEGIYALRADGVAAGFGTGGVTWGGTLGPFKSTIGPDGHVYVADLSNDLAYEISPDLQSSKQLITAANRTTGQYVNSIHVTGTQAGGDRSIYLVNGHYLDARVGVIKYDLADQDTVTANDTGTQFIGTTAPWSGYYPYDITQGESGDWYATSYRSTAGQAWPIVKFDGSGTPPLEDDILWSASKDYAGSPVAVDVNEDAGIVAYVAYDNGVVRIFNSETGEFIESFAAGARGRDLSFDAAGNLVVVDSNVEQARFFTPGGFFRTTFGSDGTFSVVPEPTTLSLVALGGLAVMLRRRRQS